MDRAERELPGKIESLLAKKPSRARVWLTLLAWRVQYRLSEFKLTGGPPEFAFFARVNPPVKLGKKGWTFEDMDVIKVLDKIAREMLDAAETEMDDSATPTANGGLVDLTSRKEPAAALAALERSKSYKIGEVGGEDIGFQHSSKVAPFGGQFGWQGIAGLGAQKGNRYPELQEKLKGVDVGEAMTQLLRDKKLDPKFAAHKQELGELYGLLMAKEPSHYYGKNARDLVHSLMTMEMMTPKDGAKGISLEKAFEQHPATYGKAQRGARRVTGVMEGSAEIPRERTKIRELYDERLKRERRTIKAWFKRHARDLPVLGRKPTLADVEDFVRKKLGEYIRGTRG